MIFSPCCLILKDGSRLEYPDVLTAVMAAGGLRSGSWTPAVTAGDLTRFKQLREHTDKVND